jgi:hypothetical protein
VTAADVRTVHEAPTSPPTSPHWSSALTKLKACPEAITWAKAYKTPQGAWRACKRADWLLWISGRLVGPGDDSRKPLVLAACACARTALRHVPAGEMRPLRAIETAEAWCRGEASLEQVRAASTAYAAYYAAAAAAAAAAAYYAAAAAASAAANASTAYAAAAASAAYYAAAAAADAAYSADAAADAAASVARVKALADMAVLVRKHLKCPRLP